MKNKSRDLSGALYLPEDSIPIQGQDSMAVDDWAMASFLDVILDVFMETLRADRASVLLLNPVSQMLSIEAARGIPEQIVSTARVAPGEGIVGVAVAERVPMLIRKDEKPPYLRVPLTRPELTASFVVPILHENRSLGAICASTSREPERFSRRNMDWMVEVANRLSPVLYALQQQRKRRQAAERLSYLLGIINHLAHIEDDESAIQIALRTAVQLSQSEHCFYAPVPTVTQDFYLSARRQLSDTRWDMAELEYFEHLGKEAIEREEPIDVLPELLAPPPVRQALTQHKIDRVLLLPVQTAESLSGLLYTFPPKAGQGVERLLQLLASHLGVVLARLEHLKHLENLAFIDEMTRTYNRKYWMERFREEFARSQRNTQPLSIILFDIDNFKDCNDRYGHRIGDQALACVAQTLRRSARNFDNVCRFGGEEFTVLLPQVDGVRAVQIAERIRSNVEQSSILDVGGQSLRLTVSGGVASFPEHAISMEDLLEAADKAMYQAKRQGKNRVCAAPKHA